MSKLRIGIVSEGPTDYIMITGIIRSIFPGEYTFLPIQPDESQTTGLGFNRNHSNGWKGVLSWCEEASSIPYTIPQWLENLNIDILIIHIDADVAREPEINCAKPCPQAEDTVKELEIIIQQKLKLSSLQSNIFCCIPSDNTEAWILTAVDTNYNYHNALDTEIECISKPDDILSLPPFKYIRRKDGKPKKNQRKYEDELVPIVVEKWDYVREYCTQAEKLHQNLNSLM